MDIVVGDARLYAVGTGKTLGWVIHGGRVLFDKSQALRYASKTNQLIQRSKQ